MEESGGVVRQQKKGQLSFDGVASPEPPEGTIFPTTQAAYQPLPLAQGPPDGATRSQL